MFIYLNTYFIHTKIYEIHILFTKNTERPYNAGQNVRNLEQTDLVGCNPAPWHRIGTRPS